MNIPSFMNNDFFRYYEREYVKFFFYDIYLLDKSDIVRDRNNEDEYDDPCKIPVTELLHCLDKIDNKLFCDLLEAKSVSNISRLIEQAAISSIKETVINFISDRILKIAMYESPNDNESNASDRSRIIRSLIESNQIWIPVNIEPYSGVKWRVMHKFELVNVLSYLRWKYEHFTISGWGLLDTSFCISFEDKNWFYLEALEFYLPLNEQERIVLSLQDMDNNESKRALNDIKESESWYKSMWSLE